MSSDIKTVDLTIALPPRRFGDEDNAIVEKLNKLKSQYVPEVDGVLIKWSDLNILNDKGIIIDDQPFIFYKVSFTAHVFKPIEGKLVKGKVQRILKYYFIAEAMNSFPVTVSIPEAFLEHTVVRQLMVEHDIYFRIKGASDGVYRGELDDECLELIKNSIKEKGSDEKTIYDYAKDFEY